MVNFLKVGLRRDSRSEVTRHRAENAESLQGCSPTESQVLKCSIFFNNIGYGEGNEGREKEISIQS